MSGGVEDRVDAFVLSWFLSRVVESVPHARPGSREFSLGGVLWKTVLYGLAYVAGFACGWLLLFGQDQDWVRSLLIQVSFPVLFSFFVVLILLWRFEGGNGCPGPWFVVVGVLVFPLVMRLARNGFVSWVAVVVLCVVPSWMRAKATGSVGVSFSGAAWRALSAPCGSCWACGRSESARARIVMPLSNGWRLGRWCSV